MRVLTLLPVVAGAALAAGCVRVSVNTGATSFPTRVHGDTDLYALVEELVGSSSDSSSGSSSSSSSSYTIHNSFGRSVAVKEHEMDVPLDPAGLPDLLDRLQLRLVEVSLDAEAPVHSAGEVVQDEDGGGSALVTYAQGEVRGSVLVVGRPAGEGRVELFARLEEVLE
jgi:hypothetical protein